MAAEPDELQEVVAEAAEEYRVPGVAVGIVHDGEERYVYHGVTSVEHPLPVDEHTLFQFGSTGKTYTATAMMRLVERDRIDLDAPVRTYIPHFRVKDEDVSAKVTVFQLLNHTAGWDGDFFKDTGPGDDAIAKFVEAMADLAQATPLGGPASYNNAAFSVAGHVIERVTGMTYDRAIKELVLEPLGLSETFADINDVITRGFAVGHELRDDEVVVTRPWALPRSGSPAGSLVSSVPDQIRYARFHLGDGTAEDGTRILSEDTIRRMQQPTVEMNNGGHVGISWMIRELDGATVVAHGGTSLGQQAGFEMVPERGFAVAVLTNGSHAIPLIDAVNAWAFESYLGLVEPEPEPIEVEPGALQEFAGRYLRPEVRADVAVEGNRLRVAVDFTEQGREEVLKELGTLPALPAPFLVALIGPDEYLTLDGEYKGMRGKFLRGTDGKITSIDLGGRLAERAPA
ncbi:MAG TPA: serine hydrolase domain-containing protein [Actinomycetota bacterium]|nr:serine hydrolase domain-containing protein [Actinomycetota bacterium]